MDYHEIMQTANELGASRTAKVDISKLKYYPELREMCEMNSCGKFASNWSCPPACGDVNELSQKVASYKNGVAYQYIGKLEDSFDFEGMMESGAVFAIIMRGLKDAFAPQGAYILGAGSCSLCENCTYPNAPCIHPDQLVYSVEACGINVSELCTLAGLNYINGQNTVTYTGLVLFNQ